MATIEQQIQRLEVEIETRKLAIKELKKLQKVNKPERGGGNREGRHLMEAIKRGESYCGCISWPERGGGANGENQTP